MIIIILIISIIILWKIIAYIKDTSIKVRDSNVIGFFGGLGTGKTFLSVIEAKKRLRYNRKHINKDAKLYSNIPIKVGFKKYSEVLTNDILMLQKRIEKGSITLIDEIGQYISQFDFKNENTDCLEEFMRLYRHYTEGGYLIVNDQSISNVELNFRRRINIMYELLELKCYPIHIRVEGKEMINTEDNFTMIQGDEVRFIREWRPLYKVYDTYVYSDRYKDLKYQENIRWWKPKTNYILQIPKNKYYSKTLKKDLDYPYSKKEDTTGVVSS